MRLIDADALFQQFAGHSDYHGDTVLCKIATAPTVTPPVRTGRWVDNGIPGSMLRGCSLCGFTCGAESFFYCPKCGAKMDLEG